MKHRAKKSIAGDRLELQKTGGGCFASQVDDVDHKMLSLLGHRAVPLANAFDSDAAGDHNGAYNWFFFCTTVFVYGRVEVIGANDMNHHHHHVQMAEAIIDYSNNC